VSYSDIEEGWEGDGNIDADPLFSDTTNGDFTLQPTSPCIDAGDPDLDGDGTDYTADTDDQDPDGSRLDMGAYYFDQTDVNIVSVTPDSLDFGTDLDTLEILLLYVGLGDLTWSITDAPDWLTFVPSQSGRTANNRAAGLSFINKRKFGFESSASSNAANSRSSSDIIQAVANRSLLDVGIAENQFVVNTNFGNDTLYVVIEQLYVGPVWHVSTTGSDSNYGNEPPKTTMANPLDTTS